MVWKTILLSGLILSCISLSAQVADDPSVIGKDGLPSRPQADSENDRNDETIKITRQPISGTINRTEEEQPESDFENTLEGSSHFKNDTTTIIFFDDKGNRIKNPMSIYRDQTIMTQDSARMKTNTNKKNP